MLRRHGLHHTGTSWTSFSVERDLPLPPFQLSSTARQLSGAWCDMLPQPSPLPPALPQFVREFARLGLTRSVGGVLALAMMRELSPVVTAIIMAGRVGSSFAAELGTMQVCRRAGVQVCRYASFGTTPPCHAVMHT